jgi:tight adherence protein B
VRKLIRAILGTLAVLLLLASPAFAGADESKLTRVTGARFPERAFVLTLPAQRTLLPETIKVRENGTRVSELTVVPANSIGRDGLGVVLVIDASESMKGRAIEDAMAAARAFARQRNPQQQLGVVVFNREATVTRAPTADEAAIGPALASTPQLADGTHLYDAVATGVAELKKAGIKAGSVVVLSDGADTGSDASAREVAIAADRAGVRIFSVGLRSQAFDHRALEILSAAGHGEYSEARSSAGLEPIYAALGSRLAHEYVIRYRSLSKLGTNVQVKLTAPGIVATSDYVAPAVSAHSAAKEARSHGFWGSSAALVVISFGCALLVGLAVMVLLGMRPRTRTVQQRLEGFVSVEQEEPDLKQPHTGKMLEGAERSLARTQWWTRFKLDLEIASISMPAVQLLAYTAIGTLFAMWMLVAITGSGLGAMLALATPAVVKSVVSRKADRQRKLFADQLADNLQVIASAMRAGHSFIGALSVAVEDAAEPARSEFRRAIADEKLGVSLEDSLTEISGRMRSRDLEQVVLVAMLQRETGGNTAEVIDRVSETIRHRAELRRTIATLTTQGRMARWIVSLLPPSLLAIITAINPEYMKPLIATTTGHVLMAFAAILVVSGSLVIKKIVHIEV